MRCSSEASDVLPTNKNWLLIPMRGNEIAGERRYRAHVQLLIPMRGNESRACCVSNQPEKVTDPHEG